MYKKQNPKNPNKNRQTGGQTNRQPDKRTDCRRTTGDQKRSPEPSIQVSYTLKIVAENN